MARRMNCPVCNDVAEQRFRPFCSRRCADIDLGRWLDGSYVIPPEERRGPDTADRDLRTLKEPETA